tara:strand:+ start:212 stop:754 length:543 start_codon:yes stop_codon:yes gene_type:complete
MGLEEILKQVEETGKEKAAAIRKETVEEVEAKMTEASKESDTLVSQIKLETSRRIEQLKQQEIPAAELEVKRNLLEMQKDLLLQTKSRVMQKLEDTSPKDLEKIYSNLLKNVPKKGKLYCRKKDQAIFKKISKLTSGGTIDDLGFLVEAGEYRLDFRFSTLVNSSWQNHLSMVSGVLFTK